MELKFIRYKSILAFWLFSSLLWSSSYGQSAVIDSFQNLLEQSVERDTQQVEILNELAFAYHRIDPNKSIIYAEEAGQLADSLNYKIGKAGSIYYLGIAKMMKNEIDEALENFYLAIELNKAIDNKKGMSSCYNAIGVILNYQNKLEEAISCYQKGLDIDRAIGIRKNIGNYLYNIGTIYIDLGKYEEALNNFTEALSLYEEFDNELGFSNALNGIATVHTYNGDLPTALEYSTKSLLSAEKSGDSLRISNAFNAIGLIYEKKHQNEKALEYFTKSLEIKERFKHKRSAAALQNNIAIIYIAQNDLKNATEHLERAIELGGEHSESFFDAKYNFGYINYLQQNYDEAIQYYEEVKLARIEYKDLKGLSKVELGIAEILIAQEKHEKALKHVLKSISISDSLNLLTHKIDGVEFLAEIYKNTNQFEKALANHEQYKILSDSFYNKENVEKMTQLEYQYKYDKKLEQAKLKEQILAQEVALTNQNLKKSRRNFLLGIILFLLTTLALGIIILFMKLRNIRAVNKNILIEQKLLRTQMTPHFIFNALSVLQGMILNKEEKRATTYLSKFSKLLRITLENSRDKTVLLSHELTAIENYLALQNLENESYEYSISIDESIDEDAIQVPPMLIQPFVENAIEHGFEDQEKIRKIDIQLDRKDEKLTCTILDNGIGFDSNSDKENSSKKSLSTTITAERLEMLSKNLKSKGSMKIENRNKYNEQGTKVTLVIPYKIEAA